MFLVHLYSNIFNLYKDSISVALYTYFALLWSCFCEFIKLGVKNKRIILTHLRYFSTLGKGNGNVFRANKKSFSEQSHQLFILAHSKSVKRCHGELSKEIQRCDVRISFVISWRHAGNYFQLTALLLNLKRGSLVMDFCEREWNNLYFFRCHFCSRVLSNSLTFDL